MVQSLFDPEWAVFLLLSRILELGGIFVYTSKCLSICLTYLDLHVLWRKRHRELSMFLPLCSYLGTEQNPSKRSGRELQVLKTACVPYPGSLQGHISDNRSS